jgi:hypothetical protein
MSSVVFYCYTECNFAKCYYVECHYAHRRSAQRSVLAELPTLQVLYRHTFKTDDEVSAGFAS